MYWFVFETQWLKADEQPHCVSGVARRLSKSAWRRDQAGWGCSVAWDFVDGQIKSGTLLRGDLLRAVQCSLVFMKHCPCDVSYSLQY